MDGNRFDNLTRMLAGELGARASRRAALKAAAAGLLAALGVGRAAEAQVTQAQCGNVTCANNPGRCAAGCVCCGYRNAVGQVTNSRCRPPGTCAPGVVLCPAGQVLGASGACSAPTTTTTTTAAPCGGEAAFCAANGDCCSGICQGEACVATLAGTCTSGIGECGTGLCDCAIVDGTLTCGAVLCPIVIDGPEDCPAVFSFFNSVSICGGPGCVALCGPGPGCFTRETRIAMADGTSRPIELVAVGDLVLGQGGINRVESVMRPRLGSKPLYALNDGPFFVTAEHPFLTDTGWKAINPSESAAENPRLVVGRLTVGDRLLALAGVPVLAGGENPMETVIPDLTPVAVELIRETHADPATLLYNLRLDGDHTYVANDVVVHNK